MRIPRRITAKWIEKNLKHERYGPPCEDGLAWFRYWFPKGFEVKKASFVDAYDFGGAAFVDWFAQCVLGEYAEEVLYEESGGDEASYIDMLWSVIKKKLAPAKKRKAVKA